MQGFQAMTLWAAMVGLACAARCPSTLTQERAEDPAPSPRPLPPGERGRGEGDPDEQFLKESKVATDQPGLVKYLAERSGHDDDLLRLEELIKQLGSPDFKARRQAIEKLVAVVPPAHA